MEVLRIGHVLMDVAEKLAFLLRAATRPPRPHPDRRNSDRRWRRSGGGASSVDHVEPVQTVSGQTVVLELLRTVHGSGVVAVTEEVDTGALVLLVRVVAGRLLTAVDRRARYKRNQKRRSLAA